MSSEHDSVKALEMGMLMSEEVTTKYCCKARLLNVDVTSEFPCVTAALINRSFIPETYGPINEHT